MVMSFHGTIQATDRCGPGTSGDTSDPQFGPPPPVSQSIDGPDGRILRTDGGGTTWPGGDPDPPDLLSIALGRWQPTEAPVTRYLGEYALDGGFLRLDLVFLGLVNPPGPITVPFLPGLYGPSPVFGFVEMDLDRNINSGGEIIQPEFRYNGNVARFGGRPVEPEFVDRISIDGLDSDGNFSTTPWFDRSGEDFHLAFIGGQIVDITDQNGNQDFLFDSGETWLVQGDFLHRAHGYEIFSFAGSYQPLVELRFAHNLSTDTTRVTLVYPLTNDAFAEVNNEPPEPQDIDDFNANSIAEALFDLQLSAQFGPLQGHPYHPIIESWAFENPAEQLNAHTWRMTALFATVADEVTSGGIMVYSDVWPNVRLGDFNGDGLTGNSDAALVDDFIVQYDNDPVFDADGLVDGRIELVNFGLRFSIFDVDYDGDVDADDAAFSLQMPGDFDNNGTVDLKDYADFQHCFRIGPQLPGFPIRIGCLDAFDLDDDNDVTLADFALLLDTFTGP